jgi:hypothetical protein
LPASIYEFGGEGIFMGSVIWQALPMALLLALSPVVILVVVICHTGTAGKEPKTILFPLHD